MDYGFDKHVSPSAADRSLSTHLDTGHNATRRNQSHSPNRNVKLRRKDLCDNIRNLQVVDTHARQRKSVTFADSDHDGVHVRVYDCNVPPEVPDSVFSQLTDSSNSSPSVPDLVFVTNFLSTSNTDTERSVQLRHVCVHRLVVTDDVIVGHVTVSGAKEDSSLFVRFTADKWATYADHEGRADCTLKPGVGEFSFRIAVSADCLAFGSQMEFAVCLRRGGQQFWDNNKGLNYRITRTVSPH